MLINRYKYRMWIVLLLLSIGLDGFGQSSDSLRHYLDVAVRNNPALKADSLAHKAFLQKIPQAGAYQDPQLDVGIYPEPMDILGGRQVADFTIMQMFPWFGTKKAAQKEAKHNANAQYEKYRETRDQLYLDVYTQWFVLGSLQQRLINSRKNKELLLQFEDLVKRKFSSPTTAGASGLSNVLRVQLEVVELDNTIESLLSEMRAEKAKFNALLNRPSESEVVVPDSVIQLPFLFDMPTVMNQIKNQNPALRTITEQGMGYKAKAEADKKKSYPMFGLGLQYMLINNATSGMEMGMEDMNGKDMFMPMVSLTIPIYRNKYKAQQREGKLWWQSNQEKYKNTLNALEAELIKTKHLLDDASRKIVLYQKQADLAHSAYNLVLKEFVSGKSDLTNVIQVQRQLLDYQLKEAEAIASYNTMVASIQKLVSSAN